MASQNAAPVVDSSFSQAYSIFSKGVDAHSSILDTSSTFKKPFPSKSAQNVLPQSNRGTSSGRPPPISNNRAGGQKMQPPPRVPLPRVPPPPAQPRYSFWLICETDSIPHRVSAAPGVFEYQLAKHVYVIFFSFLCVWIFLKEQQLLLSRKDFSDKSTSR